eukprot:2650564-Rhodomonas_salina.1
MHMFGFRQQHIREYGSALSSKPRCAHQVLIDTGSSTLAIFARLPPRHGNLRVPQPRQTKVLPNFLSTSLSPNISNALPKYQQISPTVNSTLPKCQSRLSTALLNSQQHSPQLDTPLSPTIHYTLPTSLQHSPQLPDSHTSTLPQSPDFPHNSSNSPTVGTDTRCAWQAPRG